jgi:hypothetical protein
MMRFNKVDSVIVIFLISWMQKETRIRVTFVSESTSDLFVAIDKSCHFVLWRVALATSLVFEAAFPSQEQDTNGIFAPILGGSVVIGIMTVNTIRSIASGTVLTLSHVVLVGIVFLVTGLKVHSTIVIHVVLTTGHD